MIWKPFGVLGKNIRDILDLYSLVARCRKCAFLLVRSIILDAYHSRKYVKYILTQISAYSIVLLGIISAEQPGAAQRDTWLRRTSCWNLIVI
jgi:hypothetical protein